MLQRDPLLTQVLVRCQPRPLRQDWRRGPRAGLREEARPTTIPESSGHP